jgi:hypothetical protein
MPLLLGNDSCQSESDYSEKILRFFIKSYSKLFGSQFFSFNVTWSMSFGKSCEKTGVLKKQVRFRLKIKCKFS